MSDSVTNGRKQQDFDDLQREIAGLDVGRQQRFLPEGYNAPRSEKARADEAQVMRVMTALQRMMLDEEYAALYTRVHNTVSDMELAVDAALEEARNRKAETTEQLEALRARAGTLDDGTRVYRSASGEVFTEDGKALEAGEEDGVTWGGQPPSWEDYRTAKGKADAAQADVEEIETYQREVLQPARDRLEDQDNPVTKPELEQIEQNLHDRMPDSVRIEHSTDNPAAAVDTNVAVAVPVLKG